jgi:hypothetical protein
MKVKVGGRERRNLAEKNGHVSRIINLQLVSHFDNSFYRKKGELVINSITFQCILETNKSLKKIILIFLRDWSRNMLFYWHLKKCPFSATLVLDIIIYIQYTIIGFLQLQLRFSDFCNSWRDLNFEDLKQSWKVWNGKWPSVSWPDDPDILKLTS